MESKAGFSAPSRRMRYSNSAAKSISVIPGRTNARVSANASELVRTERRMRSISPGDLTMRRVSTRLAIGSQTGGPGQGIFQGEERLVREVVLLVADAADGLAANPLPCGEQQRSPLDMDFDGGFRGSLQSVARVREEDDPLGEQQHETVAARETGEVADVGGRRDHQGLHFVCRKRLAREAAALVEFGLLCHSLSRSLPEVARLSRSRWACEASARL